MKTLPTLLLALFFCAGVARAQEASAAGSSVPPALTVEKLKWSREMQSDRLGDWYRRSPWPSAAGGFPTLDQTSVQYPQPIFRDPPSPFPRSGRFPYVYVYSAKISNNSTKAIKAVSWEYVVSEPGSDRELSRHRFYSHEKINRNSSATLRGRSVAPPSNVVSVKGLEKDKRSPYNERVEFKCVIYTDGTTWQSPSATESECLQLKERPKIRIRRRM